MNKEKRKCFIQKLIIEKQVKTQNELLAALKDAGFDVTQATISRDINEMGLVRDPKIGYITHEEKDLEDVFHWVKDVKVSGPMVVVLTKSGAAQTVALAMDKVSIDGVIGSVAGDDTIFLASEQDKINKITQYLKELTERVKK